MQQYHTVPQTAVRMNVTPTNAGGMSTRQPGATPMTVAQSSTSVPIPQSNRNSPAIENGAIDDGSYWTKLEQMKKSYVRPLTLMIQHVERVLKQKNSDNSQELGEIRRKLVLLFSLLHSTQTTQTFPKKIEILNAAEKQIERWMEEFKKKSMASGAQAGQSQNQTPTQQPNPNHFKQQPTQPTGQPSTFPPNSSMNSTSGHVDPSSSQQSHISQVPPPMNVNVNVNPSGGYSSMSNGPSGSHPSIKQQQQPPPNLKCFTIRRPSSHTRHGWIRLSPTVQYSPLLPPVGVWTVSQFQCD